MTTQTDLFAKTTPPGPPGLRYTQDVVEVEQEAALLRFMADQDFQPFDFQGFKARRQVVYFGWGYDFRQGRLKAATPIPEPLFRLRRETAELAGVRPDAFVQCLIIKYDPGAGIGWHRDRPQFGLVAGVSLGSDCVMRFRRDAGERWERMALSLAARSAYVLDGPARSEWQHSIAPHDRLRYSVTFRTLKEVVPLR